MQNKINQRIKMNKKAISQIIGIVLMISLILIAIAGFWIILKDKIFLSPEATCSEIELKKPIKIINACYLNSEEILIKIKRGFDNFNLNSINFIFSNGAIFNLKNLENHKCTDIRKISSEYGMVCEFLKNNQETELVFKFNPDEPIAKIINLEGELQKQKIFCYLSQKEIKDAC